MVDQQPRSTPLVERVSMWVSVLVAVVSLVVGATQERPASSVALAVGIVVVLAGAAVFLTTARKDGERRFPRQVRLTTVIAAVVLVVAASTALAVPASRDVLVHDVLGFPSPAREVRIVDVDVRENDTAYAVEITVVNKLRTEELVDEVELRVDTPCAPDAAPGHYRIDSAFQVGATDENGALLVGKAFREDDDGRFRSVVTGTITVCSGSRVNLTVRLGVGSVLPPGQHSKFTVEVPRVLEVGDTGPDLPPPTGAPAATAGTRTTSVGVTLPIAGLPSEHGERLHVTLTVGEPRARITHTIG